MSAVVAFSIIRGAETDHNELTKADIRAFLTANRYQPTEPEIERVFWRLDHNKDGKVTYPDFVKVFKDN